MTITQAHPLKSISEWNGRYRRNKITPEESCRFRLSAGSKGRKSQNGYRYPMTERKRLRVKLYAGGMRGEELRASLDSILGTG